MFLARSITARPASITDLLVPFPFLSRGDVYVRVRQSSTDMGTTLSTDSFTWSSDGLIVLDNPTSAFEIAVIRQTPPDTRLVAPGTISASLLNENTTRLLYLAQEYADTLTEASLKGLFTAEAPGYTAPADGTGVLAFVDGRPLLTPLTEVFALVGGTLYDYGSWSAGATLTDMGAWV